MKQIFGFIRDHKWLTIALGTSLSILMFMIIFGVMIVWNFVGNASASEDLNFKKAQIGANTAKLTEVQKRIALAHSEMNEAVGWGRLGTMPNALPPFDGIKQEVQAIIELTKVTEESRDLLKDLNNVIKLIEIGEDKEVDIDRSATALQYAHRILHDLDYWGYNFEGNRNTEYWRVTNFLDDSSEVDRFLFVEPLKIKVEKIKKGT